MISVLFSFIYIGITSFLFGFGIKLGAGRIFGYEIRRLSSLLYGGLAAATVYGGIYSLFSGVSLWANLGMIAVCLVIALLGREELFACLKEEIRKVTPGKGVLLLLAVLLFSYGASRGFLHFDTGLYHAQAIRWIEEYGVVYGLANLHCRLAYNSSSFVLTALYSMEFLTAQSLHAVAGFMALVLAVRAFSVTEVFVRKKVLVSDFVKVAALFYISVIFTEMVSPASDYFAMLFLFYIVISWIELEEEGCKEIVPYGLLCVVLAVGVTIKLSAAVMLLLVLKPAVQLIREKRYGQIGIFLLLGIVAVFPYLARNVILSGWLIYPFPSIDLFSFDWEIPAMEALYDSEEIKVYAKGMTDVNLKNLPMSEWLPGWFQGLKALEKLWVLSSVASVVLLPLAGIYLTIKKRRESYGMIFMGLVLIVGYLFWQIGTPLVRYGYIYILAFPFFTVGIWYLILFENSRKWSLLFGIVLLVFLGYKGYNLMQSILASRSENYYLWQKDYYTGAYDTKELEGIKFYIPLESGQIGYDKFPSMPYEREDVMLRDGTLKGGFRRKSGR